MDEMLHRRARRYRSRLRDVAFIGITGSCGKTTTKDLIAGLLRPSLRGLDSPDCGNCGIKLAEHVLRVESHHDFCIQELGAWGPGTLDAGLELVQPRISVILNIRNDHHSAFHGVANTQYEKAKLVKCLPTDGIAVLNADDSLVWEMRKWTSASIVSFGSRSFADFRADCVQAAWPDRLSFRLVHKSRTYSVKTQLIGHQLLGSALAAIAVAVKMGIGIELAIDRLALLPPTPRRMSAAFLESGVTFIRDDFKATSDSMPELVQFLAEARATRKIAVVGRISDYPGRSRRVYTAFATAAAKVADLLVFVGERPEDLWGRARRKSPEFLADVSGARAEVRLFETVHQASINLRHELCSGDLVILKGSGLADHLERIFLQYKMEVNCWKAFCGRDIACDACECLSRVRSDAVLRALVAESEDRT